MTGERTEQQILSLITQAALRNDDNSYAELWTAARWLNGLEPADRVSLTVTILQHPDANVRTIWLTFLLDAVGKLDAELDEIAQGVPFDYDGQTLVAAPVEATS